mgnify:CR=1 FL=1
MNVDRRENVAWNALDDAPVSHIVGNREIGGEDEYSRHNNCSEGRTSVATSFIRTPREQRWPNALKD